jgi:RecA-family ATPase
VAADLLLPPRAVLSNEQLIHLQFVRPEPLVAGLIDRGTATILAGSPVIGKTWLALTLARAVASGTPWLGQFATTAGPVLIVDEEGIEWGMQERVRMLAAADGLPAELPIHYAIGHGAKLDTPEGVKHIEAMITEHRPVLTIFDSLTRFHGKEENDAGQMADVFGVAKALMRTYGTGELFVDHLRKQGTNDKPEDMLRGSTEKRA